jgi:hypothetical protein
MPLQTLLMLFGRVAEPAAAVGFPDGVMSGIRHPSRYDCAATLRPDVLDGTADYAYS